MSRLGARTAVIATGLALVVSACSGGSRPAGSATPASSTTTAGTPRLVVAVGGLCLARSLADTDPGSVPGTFYDRSHEALHTLARTLEPIDRSLAARLLEAKESVEADVNAKPLLPTVGADLDHLIDVTRQVLERLSIPAVPCP
ncbi:MAG: hypothetical protein M3011_14105 [Actinomycetota bacterium]|nr:hypothetical protein [Actinomycetota bacterium]